MLIICVALSVLPEVFTNQITSALATVNQQMMKEGSLHLFTKN